MLHFLNTEKTKIAYHASQGKKPITIVFLGGFMSDMEGTKALALEAFSKIHGFNFIRFDYFGHGQSSGEFKEGTIGHWKEDVLNVIDQLTTGELILVGSSMGGWLMLLAALERKERIKGLVGIAAAPDFTENRIWDLLDPASQEKIQKEGMIFVDPYPITYRLIEEARAHLLLNHEIDLDCPIRLLQGGKDTEVSENTPLKLIKLIKSENITYEWVKNADHRFSSNEEIELIKLKILDLTPPKKN